MSTATKETPRSATRPLGPPEERFWKRYSPHGEMPLSLAGSFAFHVLAFGGLILVALYLGALLFRSARSLPVEPVRLEIPGGGGSKAGPDPGKGGSSAPTEDPGINKGPGAKDPSEEPTPPRPALTVKERKQLEVAFTDLDVRFLAESRTAGTEAFTRLNENIRKQLSKGINAGAGKGGTGEGGGKGIGTGPGEGSGTGAGKATLGPREKRMLRWTMRFTASRGPEYVNQLRGLGAILAIPVTEGPEPRFQVVKDLSKRPARLENEDLSKIQRIYWIDDKLQSVNDVMVELGLSVQPSRFVAFMPETLEKRLFELEEAKMKAERGSYDEDQIMETVFRVVSRDGKYDVELDRVTYKMTSR